MTSIAATPLDQEPTARRTSPGASWVLLSLPMLLTLAVVFAVPIGCLIVLSFYSMTGPATVGDHLTAENYLNFFTDFFYFRILLNTFWLGAVVVISCLVIGYPVSYFLARTRSRWRGFLLFMVVAPLLVSAVVRNIGWFPILSNSGLVNWLLLKFGLVSQPVPLISNFTGVVIGLVHALLPFMILTLTTVIQRIEPELEEASASLGARPVRTFFEVMLPLSLPGLIGGLTAGLHHGDRCLHHAGDHGRQSRAGDGDIHRPAVPHRPRLCARRDRGVGPDAADRPVHASGGAVGCAVDRCGAMTRVILPAVLPRLSCFCWRRRASANA
jgi:putative spermidine/putrescine transport system permease protein